MSQTHLFYQQKSERMVLLGPEGREAAGREVAGRAADRCATDGRVAAVRADDRCATDGRVAAVRADDRCVAAGSGAPRGDR